VINGHAIKDIVESQGLEHTCSLLEQEIIDGKVRPEDFSFRELAEAFCGHEWVAKLDPRRQARFSQFRSVMEAGEGVDVTAFGNITGQIIYSKINQGWNGTAFIGDKFFETVPTMFDGEKVPGIGRIPSEGFNIRPGQPYPEMGFGEQFWSTPSTAKHGGILSLTKEAIFFDRTGLLLRRAGEIGESLRWNKEDRQLSCIGGLSIPVGNQANEVFYGQNHNWNGTAVSTYSTSTTASSATVIGQNSQATTPLTDWTSVNTAIQLFDQLLDPDTLRPISIMPNILLVMPQNFMNARRIIRATNVRETTPGFATSGNVQQTDAPNPLDNYEIVKSPRFRQLVLNYGSGGTSTAAGTALTAAQADAWWFLCEPKRAFWYMENWPLTVLQAPTNSIKEFEQDIVMRWKGGERGVPFVADPRYIVKMYNN